MESVFEIIAEPDRRASLSLLVSTRFSYGGQAKVSYQAAEASRVERVSPPFPKVEWTPILRQPGNP